VKERHIQTFGEIEVYEPMRLGELSYVWENMRGEEKEQSVKAGETWEDALDFLDSCRRTMAVWHGNALLGVITLSDLPDGSSLLNLVRAEQCMDTRKHKFTWAKTIGDVAAWIKRTETERGRTTPIYAITPVDYARAIEFYCRHVHGRKATIVKLYGRDHQLIEICGEEEK